MGPLLVVVDPPVLDDRPRVGETEQPVFIEAFVVAGAVEALHEGVLNRVARFNEAEMDTVLIGPPVQGLASELGVVVHADPLRMAMMGHQTVEHAGHPALPAKKSDELANRLKATVSETLKSLIVVSHGLDQFADFTGKVARKRGPSSGLQLPPDLGHLSPALRQDRHAYPSLA